MSHLKKLLILCLVLCSLASCKNEGKGGFVASPVTITVTIVDMSQPVNSRNANVSIWGYDTANKRIINLGFLGSSNTVNPQQSGIDYVFKNVPETYNAYFASSNTQARTLTMKPFEPGKTYVTLNIEHPDNP